MGQQATQSKKVYSLPRYITRAFVNLLADTSRKRF